MREVRIKVYTYPELSDKAKEKARSWYKESISDSEIWWPVVFADVKQCARYLGITIAYNSDRPRYDKSPSRPNIYWDDYGSSFSGTWAYSHMDLVAVHEEYPHDPILNKVADMLDEIKSQDASAKISDQGNTKIVIDIDLKNSNECDREIIEKALQKFNTWIYEYIQSQYDYVYSDECVSEGIIANGYEFTEVGTFIRVDKLWIDSNYYRYTGRFKPK